MSSVLMVALALAATQAEPPASDAGCRFVSKSGAELIIFDDASATADAGDLLTTMKLVAAKPSDPVESPSKFVRYKYRPDRTRPWQWVGKTQCSGGRSVQTP